MIYGDLKEKIALVTGATGYLGSEIAINLALQGAKVYLNSRNESKIKQLQKKINDLGCASEIAGFDITKQDEVKNFFNNFKESKLNIIVNNAYNGSLGSIEYSSEEDFINSYKIIVVASNTILQESLSLLKKAATIDKDASVISIASMYGVVIPKLAFYGSKKVANPPYYGAAKAALIHWSKYAAAEFASDNIRFNSISPGAFPSPAAQKENKNLSEKLLEKIPLKKLGTPKDLYPTVLFLSSQKSSYMTGQNIKVDGGWTI